jgi:hypothetical protein
MTARKRKREREREKAKAPEESRGAELHRRSMSARPAQAPRVRAAEREGGGLMVTVRLERPRWQRFLGGELTMERTFGLDAAGREVYEWCDGRARVADLVARFAADHRLHVAEAETAVTMFLRTLLGKGLIVMEVEKRKPA